MNRFPTFHEASLFAAEKRSEGYFAEVVHDHSGLMWGEGVFTFSVLVSDEAAELDEDEEEEILVKSSFSFPLWFSKLIFWIIIIPGVVGLFYLGILLAKFMLTLILENPLYLIQGLFAAFAFCLFVTLCVKFYLVYKDNSHPLHKPAVVINYTLLFLILIMYFLLN